MVDLLGFIIQVLKWVVICLLIAYMLYAAVVVVTAISGSLQSLAVVADTGQNGAMTPRQIFGTLNAVEQGGDVVGWLAAIAGVIPAFWIAQWFWKGLKSVVSK